MQGKGLRQGIAEIGKDVQGVGSRKAVYGR